MNIKKLTQILIVFVLFLAVMPGEVSAFYGDSEKSKTNTLNASKLDLGFKSDTENFDSSDDIFPGSSLSRNLFIQDLGNVPLVYSMEYKYKEGDENLCENLNLKVWYYWYDDDGVLHKDSKYDGDLEDFNISYIDPDEDLKHSNSHEYYENSDYDENEHWFYFEVSLPKDVDEELKEKSCTFDIEAKAWMEEYTYGEAYYDNETLESEIKTSEWEDLVCEVETQTVDLIAGQDIDSGNISTWSDDDNLYIQYKAEDDWYIRETHLHIGDDVDDIPQQNGNPQPGRFDYKDEFDPLVKVHLYTIPLEDLDEDNLYIAAHAKVEKMNDKGEIEEESAWGEGDEFDGKNWAMYFTYQTPQCVEKRSVVINEIMWSGSDASSADEWVELKNTTDKDIKLEDWVLENAGDSGNPNIDLEGTITAGGYYLITNYPTDDSNSRINNSIESDLSTTDVGLLDGGERLILKDNFDRTIDETPDTDDGWAQGENITSSEASQSEEIEEAYRSMERNSDPGDGSDSSSWHTCLDTVCNDTTYWDSESVNYGTPKAVNHSDNDLSLQDSDTDVQEEPEKEVDNEASENMEGKEVEEKEQNNNSNTDISGKKEDSQINTGDSSNEDQNETNIEEDDKTESTDQTNDESESGTTSSEDDDLDTEGDTSSTSEETGEESG